jgi:NAD(P)-dependent dehydrogenase (short-subunit alcohol dehydrogenase family)
MPSRPHSAPRSGRISDWHAFVLRHKKPANLVLHFASAVMFFGAPLLGLFTGDVRFVWVWLGSSIVGSSAHYLTRDGVVTVRQATSSPKVVGYNVRMWWRVITGRYADDIRDALASLEASKHTTRVALVTGAASGMGRATTLELLQRGYDVIAAVRQPADVAALSASVDAASRAHLQVIACDLTLATQRERLVEAVDARGRLDCLVHNAAQGVFGALEDLPEHVVRQHMEVVFFGALWLTQALTPALRRAGGALIWVSSPAGVSGFPWTGAYSASKHAAEGLAESLYYELGPQGIRVRIVVPSAHRTGFVERATFYTGGPERPQAEAYRRIMQRNAARTLHEPTRVACCIADLAQRDEAPLRSYVGANVRVLRVLRHLFPAWLRHRLLARGFARALAADARRQAQAKAL